MEIFAQIGADGRAGEKTACHWKSLCDGNAKRVSVDRAVHPEPSGLPDKREADSEHISIPKIVVLRSPRKEELIDVGIEEVFFPVL